MSACQTWKLIHNPVLKMSDSELKYLHLLLFQCFWVHLRKRTKLFQFRSALTQLQLLMAILGNFVWLRYPTEFCSWSLNYKLITLQWRRKILLMIKISAIRLNKDDNLPEYNDECLLQAMFVLKQFSFVKRERSFIELYLFTSYRLSQKSALFSTLIVLEY